MREAMRRILYTTNRVTTMQNNDQHQDSDKQDRTSNTPLKVINSYNSSVRRQNKAPVLTNSTIVSIIESVREQLFEYIYAVSDRVQSPPKTIGIPIVGSAIPIL